jgi:hypothetical protein
LSIYRVQKLSPADQALICGRDPERPFPLRVAEAFLTVLAAAADFIC